MNKTAIIGLGILIVVIAIFLIRCSCGNADDTEPAPEPSTDIEAPTDNDLVFNLELEIANRDARIAEYLAQIKDYKRKQLSYDEAIANYADIKTLREEVMYYQGLYINEHNEYAKLYNTYQATLDDHELIMGDWNRLRAAITSVNNRTNTLTTSNLTAPERATFYKMWDLWYTTIN